MKATVLQIFHVSAALIPFLFVSYIGFKSSQSLIPSALNPFAHFGLRCLGYTLYSLGAFLCGLNFYLSFLRYLPYLWKGKKEEYHHISGAPLFGTLLVLIGFPLLTHPSMIVIATFLILLIDTGGPLWFLISAWSDKSYWEA